jgi:hypothetical protein
MMMMMLCTGNPNPKQAKAVHIIYGTSIKLLEKTERLGLDGAVKNHHSSFKETQKGMIGKRQSQAAMKLQKDHRGVLCGLGRRRRRKE